MFPKTKLICRNLKKIFKKGKSPAYQNNGNQPELLKKGNVLKLQVAIPGNDHETIGDYQEENSCPKFGMHLFNFWLEDRAYRRKIL